MSRSGAAIFDFVCDVRPEDGSAVRYIVHDIEVIATSSAASPRGTHARRSCPDWRAARSTGHPGRQS